MNRARGFMFRFCEEFISLIVLAAQTKDRTPNLTRLLIFQCSYPGAVVSQSQPHHRGHLFPHCFSDFTQPLDISQSGSFKPWKLVNATNYVLLSGRTRVKHFLRHQWESILIRNTWWERHVSKTPYNPKVPLNMGQGGFTGPRTAIGHPIGPLFFQPLNYGDWPCPRRCSWRS